MANFISSVVGRNARDNRPTPFELDLEQLLTHEVREDKDGPYFGPYQLGGDGTRNAANVVAYSAVVLDVDKNATAIEIVKSLMDAYGHSAVLYSTHSHSEQEPRYRLVVPLAAPLDSRFMPAAVHHVAEMYGLQFDPASASLSQLFYLPSCRPGAPRDSYLVSGERLELPAFLEPLVPNGATHRPTWNGDRAKLDELKRLLEVIPVDIGYDEYLTLLAGAHAEFDGAGEALELLLDWSSDAVETESKWDSFDSAYPGGVTFASVCALAQKHGADLRAISLASKLSAPIPIAQPVAELTPFTALKPTQLVTTGDHFLDAMEIRRNLYAGRLAQLNGAPHWWNGLHWELVDMQIMRSHAAVALCGQKVTQARVSGTVAVLADHLSGSSLGEADPVNRLVHFSNASLDTETGEVRQALPLDRHTRTLAVEYDPSAKAPTWERWLSSIFDGETERVQLLQELMGWCLVRDSLGIEKAALLIGPPRSGKGTIIRVIQGLLGAAAGSLSLPQLGDGKTLSGMRGCTVAIDSDATGPSRQEASAWLGTFKRVTANEQLPIRLLYQQTPWQGALNCKILCAANRIPSSFDDSGAMATRWVPLVFDKSYLGKEDPTLAASLIKELPGIAVWALEGLARLAANRRFTMPPSSLDKLDAMIVRSSPLTEFVDDCLTLDQDARVSESAVWDAYHLWAIQRGQDAMKRGDFLNSLADTLQGRGVSRKKSVRIDGHFHRGFTGVGAGAQEVPTNVHTIAHAQKAINMS